MNEITPHTEGGDELSSDLLNENETTWENNHIVITNCITRYLLYHSAMPSKTIIAQETGLSRETIRKHLKTFADKPVEQAQLEGFSAMTEMIMGNVLKAAIAGDLKAAKLFFETTKSLRESGDGSKATANKNNYLQINNTVINQQIIQQLKPEQLERIEQFIAKELEEKQD